MILLIGVFILILTNYISFGWSKKHSLKFANFEAISNVTRQTLIPKRTLPLLFRIIILLCIIFSLSGIGIWYDGYTSNLDYVIVVDASGSMTADDFQPSRLGAAKQAAISFVDVLDAQTNIGIISFAGSSFIDLALTNEKSEIKDKINNINIINAGGTAIGDAVVLASNMFKISKTQDKGRSVILLTDGQSNVGISIEDAITYASKNGVVVNTIGIGTSEGGTFMDSNAVTQLDSSTLQKLSEETGGKFYLVTNKEDLKNAYLSIFETSKTRIYVDATKYMLLLVFIMLLLDWVLANTRYKTII